MKRRRLLLLTITAIEALSCGRHGDDSDVGRGVRRAARASAGEAIEAAALVRAIRERFVRPTTYEVREGPAPRNAEASHASPPFLLQSESQRIDEVRGTLVPFLPSAAPQPTDTRHRARVLLAARATEPFSVTDGTSGLWIAVRLVGARARPVEYALGDVVYRAAYGVGIDIVHRTTTEGTEDLMLFETAPAESVVRYALELGENVAGMRLVGGTLEFLDAQGTPRLRVAPPYLIDAAGQQHDATIAVEGCSVDTSPIAPYHRPTTPSGAHACVVRVAWGAEIVSYPALLDPSWTTTGSMATARASHTASVLLDGRVLVAGGYNGKTLESAELYDPATGTWSSTGSMATARLAHTMSVLADGSVLVAGGYNSNSGWNALSSAELYNPTNATWSSAASMVWSRQWHTASVLADGRVLVVGGSGGASELPTAEIYDPAANGWTEVARMGRARAVHTASVLSDGTVLAAGGRGYTGILQSAEVYDPLNNSWSDTGDMTSARENHAASVLADGSVLVAGGYASTDYLASAELYDPVTSSWTTTAPMAAVRGDHTASVLPDGRVLIVGGTDYPIVHASAEVYDPLAASWSNTGSMATARFDHTASLLPDGRVLVAGGMAAPGVYFTGAELYEGSIGEPCSTNSACASGYCVDGVCCDTACGDGATDDCQACSTAAGASADGTCGPRDAGGACGSSADGECDEPDTCDGSGVCLTNYDPPTADCGDLGTECTRQDRCDGNGECSDNGFFATGTACGSPADNECDHPDTCDGFGACQANNEPLTTPCGLAGFCVDGGCIEETADAGGSAGSGGSSGGGGAGGEVTGGTAGAGGAAGGGAGGEAVGAGAGGAATGGTGAAIVVPAVGGPRAGAGCGCRADGRGERRGVDAGWAFALAALAVSLRRKRRSVRPPGDR